MNSEYNKVAEIIRVEWDQETEEVRIIMNVIDPWFKSKVLHNKEYADILTIKGRDVMIVATKENKE
jgi:hypothetical protein